MSSETTPAYLATPPDAPSDARDWLKAQLSRGVPEYPDPLRLWLDALGWRCRAVVILLYADHLTQEQVGYRLGIAPSTVYRDLQQVFILVEGAGK
jgi:DNA-directed RNA polymerase specialized sigma24 family protein